MIEHRQDVILLGDAELVGVFPKPNPPEPFGPGHGHWLVTQPAEDRPIRFVGRAQLGAFSVATDREGRQYGGKYAQLQLVTLPGEEEVSTMVDICGEHTWVSMLVRNGQTMKAAHYEAERGESIPGYDELVERLAGRRATCA